MGAAGLGWPRLRSKAISNSWRQAAASIGNETSWHRGVRPLRKRLSTACPKALGCGLGRHVEAAGRGCSREPRGPFHWRKGDLAMRKAIFVVSAIAVVALLGGLVVAATASTDISNPRTITVIEKETQFHFVDVGRNGPSLGDEFVFSGVLR